MCPSGNCRASREEWGGLIGPGFPFLIRAALATGSGVSPSLPINRSMLARSSRTLASPSPIKAAAPQTVLSAKTTWLSNSIALASDCWMASRSSGVDEVP